MSSEKRILLAEDDEADIVLVQLVLEEHGIPDRQVAVARDGAEALDYLFRSGEYRTRPPGNPELVVLDLKLPKFTGLEILKAIRSQAGTKEVPVAVYSSSQQDRDREEAIQSGANAYFVKPMELEDFRQVVASMLSLCGGRRDE